MPSEEPPEPVLFMMTPVTALAAMPTATTMPATTGVEKRRGDFVVVAALSGTSGWTAVPSSPVYPGYPGMPAEPAGPNWLGYDWPG